MSVKVGKSQAVAMFQALGFKTAGKWNKPRMGRKLTEIVETSEEDKFEIEDNEELNALLQSIVSSEDGFELVDDSEEPEKPAKDEKQTKDKPEAVVVEPKPEKKAKAKKEPKAKVEKVTKKSVVIEMVSREGGATVQEMGKEITKRGLPGDEERNTTTAKLWLPKIGFKVNHNKETGKYTKEG